jgi:multiple sugar transport system permease protein
MSAPQREQQSALTVELGQPSVWQTRWQRWRESPTFWAYVFIAPVMLGLLVFTYLPTVASFLLSFCYWNLLGAPQWVGWENYQRLLAEPSFAKVALNTGLFVVVSTIAKIVVGLGLAVLLQAVVRGKTFFRTAYFLPYITPMIGVSLVWGWLYDPQAGLFNSVLQALHLINAPVAWLYTPQTAMAAVLLLEVWKSVGYTMVLFLAGLQAIPESVYESARIDGASPWQAFWRVTLPMVSPTLFFVSLISIIQSLQAFDSIYLLTQGGPEQSTAVAVYWVYKNAFEFYRVGPASALAYVLFVVILVLTLVQWRLRKRWVLHEAD